MKLMIIITATLLLFIALKWLINKMYVRSLEMEVNAMYGQVWNGDPLDRMYAWRRLLSSLCTYSTHPERELLIEIAEQRLKDEIRLQKLEPSDWLYRELKPLNIEPRFDYEID